MKKTKILALLMSMAMLSSTAMPGTLAISSAEDGTPEYVCGFEEHTHNEYCWEAEVVCELEEIEGHTHGEECYTVETMRNCDLTEEPHECTEECEEDCGITVEHIHGDECPTEEKETLTCGKEETEGHAHGEGCYGEAVLTCTTEEHTHTDECVPAAVEIVDVCTDCGAELTEDAVHNEGCPQNETIIETEGEIILEDTTVYDDLRARADELCGVELSGKTQEELDELDSAANQLWEEIEAAYDLLTEEQYSELMYDVETVMLAVWDAKSVEEDVGSYAVNPIEGSAAENIKINLFDYGPLINEQQAGMGYMMFSHLSGVTNTATEDGEGGMWIKDTLDGAYGRSDNHETAKLSPVLKDGYPEVTGSKTGKESVKNGSLKYLFDPTEATIDESEYWANIYSDSSGYQYASVYLPVKNSGEGTGLFKKTNDGYYVYDAADNAAWYDKENDTFKLFDYVERPSYIYARERDRINNQPVTGDLHIYNTHFLPLNRSDLYGEKDDMAFDKIENNETKLKKMSEEEKKKDNESRTLYKLRGNSNQRESLTNMWFGMTMEFDFYIPKDGKLSNGEDMIFEFFGDDDVWVYIDDVLVLDIGGIHSSQPASINFTTGAVNNPTNAGSGLLIDSNIASESNNAYNNTLKNIFTKASDECFFVDMNSFGNSNTFEEYTKHTLKFFYLERGGNLSYCRLKFNMEPLPSGSVTVTKEEENLAEDFKGKTSYEFQVVSAGDPFGEDKYYQITDPKNRGIDTNNGELNDEGSYTVSENGKFYLKDGQTAVFTNIKVHESIKIIETKNSAYQVSYCINKGDVKKEDETSECKIYDETSKYEIVFINTWQKTSLKIKKSVDPATLAIDPNQTFLFKVEGTSGNTNGISMEVVLRGNQEITLKNLPVGTYNVSEDPEWSKRYTLNEVKLGDSEVEDVNGKYSLELNTSTTYTVTFTNTRDKTEWLDGNAQCINVFNIGHTKYEKDGKHYYSK